MSRIRRSNDLVTILPSDQALARLLEIDSGDPLDMKKDFYKPLVRAVRSGSQPADQVAAAFVQCVDDYLQQLRQDRHDSEIGVEVEISITEEGLRDLVPYILDALMSKEDAYLVEQNIQSLRQVH